MTTNQAIQDRDRVIIFDTTLRDGEQSAGAGLTVEEKLRIAHQLAALQVDVVEAGFAASSPGEFEAVRKIANEVEGPTICTLARAVPGDISAAGKALRGVENARIHTFISASDIHLMHQMQKNREVIMDMAVTAVTIAKTFRDDVEFSPMDATRTNPEYLYAMLEAVIKAGATTVNIPDTVGYSNPEEFGALIKGVFKNVPNITKAVVSVHCHNDLGMAGANSLAAVEAGARQVEGCINGLGERAGNASLEEVIMALETRPDHYRAKTGIVTREIGATSRMIANTFGFPVQYNKAIVGRNAFRHSSGIHQDGFLKDPSTFEIMHPDDVGWRGESVVLGKLSGRAGLRNRLEELGYTLTDEELADIFPIFKELADEKSEVTNADLEALMSEQHRIADAREKYELRRVSLSGGMGKMAEATVVLKSPDGVEQSNVGKGVGLVNAVCSAITQSIPLHVKLVDFMVSNVSANPDSLGEVTVRVQYDGSVYSGRGTDVDIVVASAKAYINAINRLLVIGEQDQIKGE